MPNETNWQDITRRLDINEASVTDTCYPKTRGKSRAIKKIPLSFTLPAVTVPTANVFGYYRRLVHQMNCVAVANFKIINTF